MTENIIPFIYNYLTLNISSKELIAAVLAALPIVEARYAIPIAHAWLELSVSRAFIICVLANMIPVAPLLFLFKPLSEKLRHFVLWRRFFDRLFERTRKKAYLVERYEALGLMIFVSVPLPITGAWTGCVAAVLFKIKFRYAFFAIFSGVICSSIISILTINRLVLWLKLFLS